MRVAVLTTGRQDWGILVSTCRALAEDSLFDLRIIAGGMHLAARYGATLASIERDGFQPAALVPWCDDDPAGANVQREAGAALAGIGDALAKLAPDALLLVGDRFETAAGALAATLARVPIVHLHGGEETEGAFDNQVRHAITKLSHLHLVSHPDHAARLRAMGEAATSIHVVGAPGLDNLQRADLATRNELEADIGPLPAPVVIVTVHPATLSGGDADAEARVVAETMRRVRATYIVTLPNADPGNEAVRAELLSAARDVSATVVEALGERRFWGLLRIADAMIGNSSSALIEAPVVQLPAVNVGDRQKGRLRGSNVVDAPANVANVVAALERVLRREFRDGLRGTSSPYGDGGSAGRIRAILRDWQPPRPPTKPALPVAS